jgi:hypothetical protein
MRSCLGTTAEHDSQPQAFHKWPIERITKGAVQHSRVLKSEPIVTGQPAEDGNATVWRILAQRSYHSLFYFLALLSRHWLYRDMEKQNTK